MTKLALLFTCLCLTVSTALSADAGAGKPIVTVENAALRLSIGTDARTIEFTDKASGANYYRPKPGAAFARVKKGGKFFDATKAALT